MKRLAVAFALIWVGTTFALGWLLGLPVGLTAWLVLGMVATFLAGAAVVVWTDR